MVCKCNSCGNYIHIERINDCKCIYCGSLVEWGSANEDNYVEMKLSECERALGSIDALEKYDDCIEKFPNISRLYWGRMLARHSCEKDKQLLSLGVNFQEDSDYILAYHFANEEERLCYTKIANCRDVMRDAILSELMVKEKEQIRQTDIENIQARTASKIEILRAELERKISELDFIEKKIRDLQTDCMVIVISNRSTIDYAVDSMDKYKTQIYDQKEIENDEYMRLQVELGKLLFICEMANDDINNLQYYDSYQSLQQLKQDQVVAQKDVEDVISQIEIVDESMRSIISDVFEIKDRFKKAADATKNTGFTEASSLLGLEKMNIILSKALKA